MKFGEGDYDGTEKLIRQLLTTARPGVALPPPVGCARHHPTVRPDSRDVFRRGQDGRTTRGTGRLRPGASNIRVSACPATGYVRPRRGHGHWTIKAPRPTATLPAIKLNYHAEDVYIVVGGTGSLSVTRDGKTTTVPVSGPPTSHQIVATDEVARDSLDVRVSKGLQVFSFTYG